MKNIKKFLLVKATVKSITHPNKPKKEYQKSNCHTCGKVIQKRKRKFIQVTKRCEIAWMDCPSIYFHEECWADVAGEEFEIK